MENHIGKLPKLVRLLAEINSLSFSKAFTKQERIVKGIINCIDSNKYLVGDGLPSVNELSTELGYARETIVKAYKELKERGLIRSKPGVGYFVASNNIDLKQSIALVLYGFQTFQQEFYNTFRKSLGEDYHIDVFFHHNNLDVYESILDSIKGKYATYVVAPIQATAAEQFLDHINHERLLIIDRYQFLSEKVSKVTQEFEQSMLRVLEELTDRISNYNKVILYYRDNLDYPQGIHTATLKYCNDNNISLEVKEEFDVSDIARGRLFFTLGDGDLWPILKFAKSNGLEIGVDIGILSHNDSPVKEIIQGGITTFSTDFNEMAVHAAQYIRDRKFINKIIPSKLIKRKSL